MTGKFNRTAFIWNVHLLSLLVLVQVLVSFLKEPNFWTVAYVTLYSEKLCGLCAFMKAREQLMKGSFLDVAGRWESSMSVNRSVSFIRLPPPPFCPVLPVPPFPGSFIPGGPFSSIVRVFSRACVCAECVSKATFVGSRRLYICNTMQLGGGVSGKTEERGKRFGSLCEGGLGIVAWLSKCLFWVCALVWDSCRHKRQCLRHWRRADFRFMRSGIWLGWGVSHEKWSEPTNVIFRRALAYW